MSAFEHNYSTTDKLLHNLAFSGLGLQRALADLEGRLYRKQLARVQPGPPVFVTALPRAGTTLLLEVLNADPAFATHNYRDMPFLLCPLLWNSLSGGFRKQAQAEERAHGDGMLVGYDSPEAFEEVIWRLFWPRHYQDDRILPWNAQSQGEEFARFYAEHMRRIIALRCANPGGRYLSKNNVNFARTKLLARLFPDCRIVVPLRNPRDHIGSLLTQHRRFLQVHAEDAFARRYMDSIGHLEFGALARPINVGNWLADRPPPALEEPTGWLDYWCAAAEYLLALDNPNLVFFDYDRCCTEPEASLTALAETLGCDAKLLLSQAGRFRPPSQHSGDIDTAARADALHARLARQAINA